MSELDIRPGQARDAQAIARILESADWPHPYFTSPAVRQQAVERQIDTILNQDQTHLLVAELNKKVIGYALWQLRQTLFLPAPDGCVSDLFVLDTQRGKRVGSILLNAVIEQARDLGCCRITLQTRKARQSYKRSFYKKAGWTERDGVADFVFELNDSD